MLPTLGVCYYPEHFSPRQWHTDAKNMVACGIRWVRIGEFSWSCLEPSPGRYTFAWLDKAIQTLSDAGLCIVLGTPSAAPPRWMLSRYPDMLCVDKRGNLRTFGSRRHYCFSHSGYRDASAHMAGLLAKRYGSHPTIGAWQIDNEYGCHDTVYSYAPHVRVAFCQWLQEKYQDIDALNQAWGNVFWSMKYSAFSEIDFPHTSVTESNPMHSFDFCMFSSDQVIRFNHAQVIAIRAYTDTPVLHNYMGRTTDFDHFRLGDDLDIATWDSYPLGFVEDRIYESEDWKNAYFRQGHPDFQAFHHDLYRAVGKGRWWVMEQQPGPVNWAPWNPIPSKGMVRLWTWEAIAHGAEVVSFFRWRQFSQAQEQMHSGLLQPDGMPTQGYNEVVQVAKELASCTRMFSGRSQKTCEVGLVFDYQSAWAWHIQPHGKDFRYFDLVFDVYKALRSVGFSIDIINPYQPDFSDKRLVCIPGLMHLYPALTQALHKTSACILYGPRCNSKTANFGITSPLPPALEGFAIDVSKVESLRPGIQLPLQEQGNIIKWFEHLHIESSCQVHARLLDGLPVLVGKDNHYYLGGWPDQNALIHIITLLANFGNMPIQIMPEGVRKRSIMNSQMYFNYTNKQCTIGDVTLSPAGVVWK